MALRDQPYLPLYIQDFMTDEKLRYCSAEASGVYIWLMCAMHKSEEYGVILLKQNFKHGLQVCYNFASQLAVQLPFAVAVIESALEELLAEKVIHLDGDRIIQRRMVKDNNISLTRALAGAKGGRKTAKNRRKKEEEFAEGFATANNVANTEYEYEYESEDVSTIIKYLNNKVGGGKFKENAVASNKFINARIKEGYKVEDLIKVIDIKVVQWLNDPKMSKYLRPQTLFNATNFESYFNETREGKVGKNEENGRIAGSIGNWL